MKKHNKITGLFIITSALFQIFGAVTDARAEEFSLPKGTKIILRLNDDLSTASNMEGDEFIAVTATPVRIGNRIAIPKGSVVAGSVSRILRPDRLKGKAVLDLIFQSIKVTGRNRSDITATLIRIIDDPAGSGKTRTAENFLEQGKSTTYSSVPGSSEIGVRVQAYGGKNAGLDTPFGLPSVFNLQGGDLTIPGGAYMEIELDRPLTLTEETARQEKR